MTSLSAMPGLRATMLETPEMMQEMLASMARDPSSSIRVSRVYRARHPRPNNGRPFTDIAYEWRDDWGVAKYALTRVPWIVGTGRHNVAQERQEFIRRQSR